MADEIDERTAQNARFEGYQVTVVAAVTAPGDPREGLVTNTVLSLASGRLVGANGSVLQTYPASPRLPSDAGVLWEGNSWRVTAVVINPDRTP